ncbi:MAG TPA: serine/threonine-protein kinase, partial [Lacunisphaera sp.]|nr:serine/threonine-protein kinase [Lacunisphaera sp.]
MQPGDARTEEEIFEDARMLSSAAERCALLDAACAGNPTLRARLESLLAAEREAEIFFAECTQAMNLPPPPPAAADGTLLGEEAIGTRIGRYKLLQKIGEGGWGVVYRAEQEEPVRRSVALKIIKLGMETKSVIARFEAERQALAMMDHPNIARVYDAGATDRGPPYFVMELVRGVKITTYCDQHRLGLRERLDLFIQVCHAIQHAHQKGIIHGDIKPSNIMVT